MSVDSVRDPINSPALLLMSTARAVAYDVLMQWGRDEGYVGDLLDAQCRRKSISPADRRLANELCHGVVRRQGTLDAILRPHARRGLENIEPGLRRMLHLGVYQLVFLSGIPSHAALFETVELAKRERRPQWTAILNGILRGVSRSVTEETATVPSARGVPLAEGTYRLLTEELFPSPESDPVGYLAEAFSLPRWLPQRWQVRMSTAELLRLGHWFNGVHPLSLRVNSLRTTRESLLQKLQAAGIAAGPGERPESIRLEGSAAIAELPGFREGEFTVQDESAMAAGALLAPQPGEQVLDLCAAPGGKTSHLAELMQNQGHITAADVTDSRLRLIDETCRRLGITIVQTVSLDRQNTEVPSGPFDAILVDAPCSNTGVLGKRPEARWRLRPEEIAELQELQSRLLAAAVNELAPGGRIVYSTCSIEPEENRAVVDRVLAGSPHLRLESDTTHLPGRPADGGYQALIRRE